MKEDYENGMMIIKCDENNGRDEDNHRMTSTNTGCLSGTEERRWDDG